MNMTKLEKLVYIGCPWLFAMVMITSGIYLGFTSNYKFAGFFAAGFGFICMSLYCVCALLGKIIEKKQDSALL